MSIHKAELAIDQAMAASDQQVDSFELDAGLKELIRIRVSQIRRNHTTTVCSQRLGGETPFLYGRRKDRFEAG